MVTPNLRRSTSATNSFQSNQNKLFKLTFSEKKGQNLNTRASYRKKAFAKKLNDYFVI